MNQRTDDAAAAGESRSNRLRVCSVAYTLYESDSRVMKYNEALAARGDLVDMIALRVPGKPRTIRTRGVVVTAVQTRNFKERSPLSYLARILLFFVRASSVLSWRQLTRRYDIVHIHSVPDFLVFTAWLPKLMGAKLILDIHDILPELYASKFGVNSDTLIFKVLLLIEKISLAFADHVIIANDIWHNKLVSRSVPPEKATALLNFPDRTVFRPRGRVRHDGRSIMIYPGTLNRHQGLDIAIEAFDKIKDKVSEAEFHIYGAGPALPELIRLVEKLGLQERILFKGLRSLHEIARAMEDADLGVVPKRKDGFGNEAFSTKIMEFMALGVPVIVSNTKVDAYYFDKSLVRFFRAGDTDDLAQAMLDMLTDRGARESLIRAGRQFVEANCWDIKKSLYLNLVDNLAEARA